MIVLYEVVGNTQRGEFGLMVGFHQEPSFIPENGWPDFEDTRQSSFQFSQGRNHGFRLGVYTHESSLQSPGVPVLISRSEELRFS